MSHLQCSNVARKIFAVEIPVKLDVIKECTSNFTVSFTAKTPHNIAASSFCQFFSLFFYYF